MFARTAALLALSLQQITIPLGKPSAYERARAPIEESGPAWAATCRNVDRASEAGWNTPGPPVRIHGNTYLVGSCGISSILIVGDSGNILIDGGTDRDADLIAANIRELGFRLTDIRFILISHEHPDHVGGISRLQQLTGATVIASAPAARVLASGLPAKDDPQAAILKPFAPVQVERIISDGSVVRLGNVQLTAIATPGHTAGGTSWRWESCDGGVCRTIVYADSLTPVSAPGYRFSDHPALVATYRASIAKIAAGRCEIILTPHPSASAMAERLAAGKTLLDESGCRTFADAKSRALDERLAKERGK